MTQFITTRRKQRPTPNPLAPTPNPEIKDAENIAAAPSPELLITSKEDLTAPPFPLNHARMLWDNLLVQSQSVTETTGTGGILTINPNTADRWTFTTSGYVRFEFATNQNVDTICIGGHNLGDDGGFIEVQIDDDGSDPPIFTEQRAITSNDAIMFHFDQEYSANRITVEVTTGATNPKYVSYISAGIALQMQRPFFTGHTPITDADNTTYYHNRTQAGNIIGQEIRRVGYQTDAQWNNIDDGWYREYFRPFKQSAKLLPFFFAWNLEEYPEDVGFCRVAQDISAAYNGSMKLRSLSFSLLGV